jgi:hypothetical protein
MLKRTFTVLLLAPFFANPCQAETQASEFIRAKGSRLVVGENQKEIVLRGVVLFSPKMRGAEEKDYEDMAKLGINTVRLALSYKFFYEPSLPGSYKESAWKWLDRHIDLAHKHRLYLIFQFFDVEGAQFVPIKDVPFDYRIWNDAQLQDRFVRLWRAIAERYKDESRIVGYSLFCEPVVSKGVEEWAGLAQRTIKAIREVDHNHIVFVERIYGENRNRRELSGIDLPPERAFVLVEDKNVVYEFYFYERDEYTHQFASWRTDRGKAVGYPDAAMKINYKEQPGDVSGTFRFDKEYLRFYLRRQIEFGRTHNVPMFVCGFGALHTCFKDDRGGARWLQDVTGLFNAERLHWTLLAYREEDFADAAGNSDVRQVLSRAFATN